MFYIDHIDKELKRYGVADTDDGVIDLISQEEYLDYISQGIKLLDWGMAKSLITNSMNRNCNYKLWRKLVRGCSESELLDYLKTYSIYTIANELNLHDSTIDYKRGCRLFDYSQTQEYFVIILWLKNNYTLILRIDSEYNCVSRCFTSDLYFEKYPSCSGCLIYKLLTKQGLKCDLLVADENYLVMYNAERTIVKFINVFNLYCDNVILSLSINKILE